MGLLQQLNVAAVKDTGRWEGTSSFLRDCIAYKESDVHYQENDVH